MQIRPILSALRFHRLATVLIVLEIALASSVLSNACLVIVNRLRMMDLPSGVDEPALAVLSLGGYEQDQAVDLNARMLSGLLAIPGMQSVSVINTVPYGPHAGTAGITVDAAGRHFGGVVDFYVGGPGSLQALGVRLVQGRAPGPEDYGPITSFVPDDAAVLVTQALARHLWPGENPLGREFWCDKYHFHVIAVMAHLEIPQPGSRGPGSVEWSVFAPAQPGRAFAGTYLLRAAPRDLPRVLRDARAAVARLAPEVVLDGEDSRTVSDLRQAFFQRDRTMAGMLVGVIVALLLVTALGIVGLASFWVGQRHKQIGIRRAVGATRADILRYFQIENFLIVTLGIMLGVLLAYGLNILLMKYYELQQLPPGYLLFGAIAQWLLGQLAVLAPALRAAAVPPVAATRSA